MPPSNWHTLIKLLVSVAAVNVHTPVGDKEPLGGMSISINVVEDDEPKTPDKPVRFAHLNNCIGCYWRSPLLLKKMSDKHPNKMKWFADQETKDSRWRSDVMYKDVIKWKTQIELFDNDFNECDSGYCGLWIS